MATQDTNAAGPSPEERVEQEISKWLATSPEAKEICNKYAVPWRGGYGVFEVIELIAAFSRLSRVEELKEAWAELTVEGHTKLKRCDGGWNEYSELTPGNLRQIVRTAAMTIGYESHRVEELQQQVAELNKRIANQRKSISSLEALHKATSKIVCTIMKEKPEAIAQILKDSGINATVLVEALVSAEAEAEKAKGGERDEARINHIDANERNIAANNRADSLERQLGVMREALLWSLNHLERLVLLTEDGAAYIRGTGTELAGFAAQYHEARAALSPEPAQSTPKDNNRCAVCAWPLAESADKGCVRGNCSMRPFPDRAYEAERANKEYGKVIFVRAQSH